MTDEAKTEAHEKAWTLSQKDANYTALSTARGKACATCRWFNPYGDWRDNNAIATCHLVDNYPEPILATGLCDRHEAKPQPEPISQEPLPVVIVEPEMVEVERELQKPGVIERLARAIRETISQPEPANVFKSINDKLWVAFYTNNFEDREGQIITEAAHDRYVARLKAGIVPMPTLRYRHIPGTDHGRALWIDRIDNYMVAVGEYSDDELGHAFSKHYQKSRRSHKNSHGFLADKTRDYVEVDGVGYWKDYNTFEITVSPAHVVANAYTVFDNEVNSMATPQSIAELKEIVGEELATKIVAQAETRSKELKELGTRYKDFTNPADATQTPPAQAAVEVVTKNAGALLAEIVADMGEIVSIQKAVELRQTAGETKVGTVENRLEKIEKDLGALAAVLKLTPRLASEASETVISEKDAETAKKELPEDGKKDSFWS